MLCFDIYNYINQLSTLMISNNNWQTDATHRRIKQKGNPCFLMTFYIDSAKSYFYFNFNFPGTIRVLIWLEIDSDSILLPYRWAFVAKNGMIFQWPCGLGLTVHCYPHHQWKHMLKPSLAVIDEGWWTWHRKLVANRKTTHPCRQCFAVVVIRAAINAQGFHTVEEDDAALLLLLRTVPSVEDSVV